MANKIKISSSEPVKYSRHDFQLSDYVYAPVSLDDPSQGNQLAYIDQQDKDGCTIIFAQTGRTVYREYDDLYLVPITEDWLKENSQVFSACNDLKQTEGDFSFSYQYKFSAKRFNRKYNIVVYELHYEDEVIYQRLCREGLNWFTCLNESQGRVTVAKIVSKIYHLSKEKGLVLFGGAGVMQSISIHDLQHFLRLCGCEELKIPQSLLED
jgi:hypothetical protein|nr:MAG TPA: hypothetical protein [Caudoviricetes sp.]